RRWRQRVLIDRMTGDGGPHGAEGLDDRRANGDALPPSFVRRIEELEARYLAHDDPIRQSGFSGGVERWRAERGPIVEAIDGDGDLLDVGCANGYLLECLVTWAMELKAIRLEPHGLDLGPRLIELARRRFPARAANFHVGNAWTWRPPRRYRFVYSVWDCVPESHLGRYVERLLERAAAPGGRLIIGAYGSRSRGVEPMDVVERLRALGFAV